MSQYSLDPIAANCYPGTTVLINKFGIKDEKTLLQAEIEITHEASARWEITPEASTFDFEHYKAIHKHLFYDLYDWAGQTRNVDIAKKGTRFCPHDDIEDLARRIFAGLQKSSYLKGQSKSKFVTSFVRLYVYSNSDICRSFTSNSLRYLNMSSGCQRILRLPHSSTKISISRAWFGLRHS